LAHCAAAAARNDNSLTISELDSFAFKGNDKG
jgi:hypothetical protein